MMMNRCMLGLTLFAALGAGCESTAPVSDPNAPLVATVTLRFET